MGEDLYRKGKKPYIDTSETEGQSEEEAASDAWNKHLLRNESIITDLFHGQFKSTVCCSRCDRVSITFDPMMTMSLPIPAPKTSFKCFYIPYKIENGYVNKSAELQIRMTDSLLTFREEIEELFKVERGSYLITSVSNNEFTRIHSCKNSIDAVKADEGSVLLYQIPNELKPRLSTTPSFNDSNNSVDE